MKRKIIAALLLVGTALVSGCAQGQGTPDAVRSGDSAVSGGYQKITPEEAYRMMEETEEYILLDVRTEEEFAEAHIDGAVLLPDYEIEAKADAQLPDRDATILVYCRSGRRSAGAAARLAEMGYTGVYDFGGILDWPYETVSGAAAEGA